LNDDICVLAAKKNLVQRVIQVSKGHQPHGARDLPVGLHVEQRAAARVAEENGIM
jgi:hypothetical protein